MKTCEPLIISSESGYNLQAGGSVPITHAWRMIARDHEQVFGREPLQTEEEASIMIRYADEEDGCPQWPEGYCLRFVADDERTVLHIIGRDELGIIYGLLHYSRFVLGVEPFWFWAELPPARRDTIVLPSQDYDSKPPKVRYRGWFVNDEVCLIGWKDDYPPTEQVWEPVFEALLRCGGNMVIPGTDLPRTGIHHKLAADMGLWITHHHAEPLGAEMFLRAFPGKQASYKEHPELFEQLWQEAIERQKGEKIVWVLSFRGQGDKPFWENDPSFNTPEKRGKLISYVVRKQYSMICECVEQPVCSMAMYGEIAELYKQGHIEVPEGVIKIWADNGYGKMVSRRHGNLNLRVSALPEVGDGGKNGVYYHVTFHDLQASNHLTQFPSSAELIVDELTTAFAVGADEYLLVNSGNILPHLYTLDLAANLWTNGSMDAEVQLTDFIGRLYSRQQQEISQLYRDYSRCTIVYGPHKDDRAGEELYHHPARQIMGFWLQGKEGYDERLCWAAGEKPFAEQVRWFKEKAKSAIPGWIELQERCLQVMKQLPEDECRRLYNQLFVQIELHLSGCRGLSNICIAYGLFLEGDYPRAFIQASHAVWSYQAGKEALSLAGTGRWEHFYRADWLTNLDNTISHADTVRRFLRIQGDSPDMFLWYKQYIMPETEKHIYLENTHRKPLSDDELARCMEKELY
ncbi:glycosyl hydrolase 115 family protein [Paenibacillus peoriae]|uniref:glycosyl hydrolase 115 family protein n=1 Tax=Paenibacillus peoriae TaxID=59893 RepID=UPI00026C5BAA|nr:glycosyl hydrolase 115 family protein [Paenibacillus peoriae]MEC0181549.1 glycosyl hydrolase 115 family protein [Paenibacillus peoriae]